MPSISQSKVFEALTASRKDPAARPEIQCTCSCGKTGTITGNPNWPTDAIARKFNHAGWHVDGKGAKAKCPDCNVPTPKTDAVMVNGSGQSGPAASSTIKAYKQIEQNFMVDEGRYMTGVSDSTIAMTFGLDPKVVASIRKENFGELKTDPEIAGLQRDLSVFSQNIEKEVSDFVEMANILRADYTKKIAEYQLRIDQAIKNLGQ